MRRRSRAGSRGRSGTPSERRSLARAWTEWWFAEIDPRGLALFRIALGVFLFVELAAFAPRVETAFSSDGVVVPVLPWPLPPPSVAWALWAALLAALAAFTLGLRTSLVAPVVLALHFHHFVVGLAVRNTAHDRLVVLLLFLSCFADLDGAWTLGRWRDHRPVSAWGARIVGLQLAALYLGSGIWKLLSPSWHGGEMLSKTLVGPWGTRAAFAVVGLGIPAAAWTAATWGIVAFELGAGFGLHAARLRKATMALGVAFHLANWILLGIPEFMVCVACYPVFFFIRDARPGAAP